MWDYNKIWEILFKVGSCADSTRCATCSKGFAGFRVLQITRNGSF